MSFNKKVLYLNIKLFEIMDLKTIKELLLKLYVADFDIEKLIDTNNTDSQPFEYTVGFEFKYKNNWHDVYMHVFGTAYIQQGYDDFHSPLGYGTSENQGEPNSIAEYHIHEIEVYYDADKNRISISAEELNNYQLKQTA